MSLVARDPNSDADFMNEYSSGFLNSPFAVSFSIEDNPCLSSKIAPSPLRASEIKNGLDVFRVEAVG